MDTVTLVKDTNGIKAGTELSFDEKTNSWYFYATDEEIKDDIVHTKTSRIQVSDNRIKEYPHLFKRSNPHQTEVEGIIEKYESLLEELQKELIMLKKLK